MMLARFAHKSLPFLLSPASSAKPAAAALSLRRWIYSPSLERPPPSRSGREYGQAATAAAARTPPSAPHLEPSRFRTILAPRGDDVWSHTIPASVKQQQQQQQGAAAARASSTVNSPPEEIWENRSKQSLASPAGPPNRFYGRSVPVDNGVGKAWIRIQGILKQNGIRRELKLTERHEKKGVKRRRLRSERWRRKFAAEVRAKVRLVNQIRLRDRMWGARY